MALEALDRLIANKAWQRGEAKEVQAEASLVIRRYLEGQFDMRAAEKTTDEVVAMLGIPGPFDDGTTASPGPWPKQTWSSLRKENCLT